jgi:HK97 family phage portal protein
MRILGLDIQLAKRGTTIDQLLAEALPTGRNTRVSERTMLQLPTVWRCIEIISTSIAGLPVHVKRENGESIERVDYPIDYTLRVRANRFMSAQTWKELMVRDVVTKGDHFSQIIRGQRTELIPLPYDRIAVELVPMDDGLSYLTYMDKESGDIFLPDDILHIRGASMDGIRGMSMIEYHRRTFGLASQSGAYIYDFFRNNATPKGIVSYDGAMKPEVIRKAREMWHKLYGVGSEHSTAFLDGGAKYTSVSLPPADAMYLDVAKYTDKQICNIYGVPMHMVNDLSDAHYNNIESSGVELVKFTLMAWINRIESEMNMKLLREVDKLSHFIDFNVDGLMRGDMKSRADYIQKMIQSKVLNANEARRIEGYNPRDGGEVYENPNIDKNETTGEE